MKVKPRLILIALVIISLLSIGVVSASENVSDVIETSDFEEPVIVEDNHDDAALIEDSSRDMVAVEDNHDDAASIEDSSKDLVKVKNSRNSKILSVENENELDVANDEENEIIKDNSPNHFNWTNLYNKTVIDNNSTILDLSDIFGKNNTNNSFLVLNFDEIDDDDRASGSYLILGLSDFLGENKTNNSYLVIGLSGLLGENKTNDHSYLVFGLSSLGLSNLGNSSFVFDLTDISKNHTIDSSYLYLDFDDPLRWNLPSFLDQGASLLGIDLDKYFNENITDLPSFLDNLNWTEILGGNTSNLTSFLDDLNWTALFNGNYTQLLESLNSSSVFGFNASDIISLIDFNLTSNFDSWNLTSLLDNLTSNFDSWNLTSWVNNFNWTNLFSGNSAGNDTGNDKNTGFNWGSIFGIKDSANGSIISNVIDWFTGKNKKDNTNNIVNDSNGVTKSSDNLVYDSIKSSNLKTYYEKSTVFKVSVISGNKPITSGKVVFIIKNKKYIANVGNNGVAVLKLKLKPGTYYVTSTYGKVSVKNKIVIKKSIITKNVSKKYRKAGKFRVKVLNSKGKVHAKQIVKIKLNGKTYTAKTNKKGIAIFNLPKTLKLGKYTIKTICKGLIISNKLTVKR